MVRDAAIDEAVAYTFPLYEVARVRYRDYLGFAGLQALPTNAVLHDPRVCDHESRWVTAPNNDTLYSRAWIDLSTGPVRIEVGKLPPDRYWSLAFLDAWTWNFAIVGSHTDGTGPVHLTLVGPQGDPGPDPGQVIRAPGQDVWLLCRWLVDPEGDQTIGQAMQSRLQLLAQGKGRAVRDVPVDDVDAASFVAVVCERLAFNPPPASEAGIRARIAELGLRPTVKNPWPELPEALRRRWSEGLGPAIERIRDAALRSRVPVQGWLMHPDTYGTVPLDRAGRALIGLGGLPKHEVVYGVRLHDDEGKAMQGVQRYCLTVPPSGVPVEAFWSICLYEREADGRSYFVDNPIRRYTIGDRTPGLRYEADGSLRIWIQSSAPEAPEQRANWLPSASRNFALVLRAYLPRPELIDGTTPLPTIRRLD